MLNKLLFLIKILKAKYKIATTNKYKFNNKTKLSLKIELNSLRLLFKKSSHGIRLSNKIDIMDKISNRNLL